MDSVPAAVEGVSDFPFQGLAFRRRCSVTPSPPYLRPRTETEFSIYILPWPGFEPRASTWQYNVLTAPLAQPSTAISHPFTPNHCIFLPQRGMCVTGSFIRFITYCSSCMLKIPKAGHFSAQSRRSLIFDSRCTCIRHKEQEQIPWCGSWKTPGSSSRRSHQELSCTCCNSSTS